MRTNAHHYIRHDAYRFMPPGSPLYVGRDVVKYFWPDRNDTPHNPHAQVWTGMRGRWMPEAGGDSMLNRSALLARKSRLAAFECDLAKLKSELAWLRFQRRSSAMCKCGSRRISTPPSRAGPRVPAASAVNGQAGREQAVRSSIPARNPAQLFFPTKRAKIPQSPARNMQREHRVAATARSRGSFLAQRGRKRNFRPQKSAPIGSSARFNKLIRTGGRSQDSNHPGASKAQSVTKETLRAKRNRVLTFSIV
jgi:hypothetical protein